MNKKLKKALLTLALAFVPINLLLIPIIMVEFPEEPMSHILAINGFITILSAFFISAYLICRALDKLGK